MSQWEEEAHGRLQEADEKQRAADRCTREGANARRELDRLKKAVESSFEDLQRQVLTRSHVRHPWHRVECVKIAFAAWWALVTSLANDLFNSVP